MLQRERETGQGFSEFGLILMCVSVIVIAILALLATPIQSMLASIVAAF